MITQQQKTTVEQLELWSAEQLLAWALSEYGTHAGIITSFQDTGCAIVDMAQRVAPGLRIITIDTLRLHDETYRLIETIERKYGIHVERFYPNAQDIDEMIREHGEYLFFDDKEGQRRCCAVRKVEPNRRALDTLDVWFTGLRRDQSEHRCTTRRVSQTFHDGRTILKIAPLADWTEQQVREYLHEHDVPLNGLYAEGYTSIGCVICTTPTRDCEAKRAGRWRWFNRLEEDKKECGIHSDGSGI